MVPAVTSMLVPSARTVPMLELVATVATSEARARRVPPVVTPSCTYMVTKLVSTKISPARPNMPARLLVVPLRCCTIFAM